jgi:hypothetical protein
MTSPISPLSAVGIGHAAQTAAGTTSATAALVLADHVWVASVAAGAGVRLKEADRGLITVTNADPANALKVYPPSGASLNGLAADLALLLPPQRSALFVHVDATKVTAIF